MVGGKTKVTLTAWPPHASDQHILLHTDSLLTVCDPSPTVTALYLKKINKKLEDFQPKLDDRVLLNEDEQVPTDDYVRENDIDDYEPAYQEV